MALGIPMYVVLGGIIATAVAETIPQAILSGFAWTAIIDRMGLRREMDVRQRERSASIQSLADAAETAEAAEARALTAEIRVAELQRSLDTMGRRPLSPGT